jgi:ligand-binding sensor domain-containing protein
MKFLVILTFFAAAPCLAQSRYRPDERIVLADFSRVQAVAVSRDKVFGATTEGLTIYDRRFSRWEPPITRVDGYPDARISAALVDPADESVWLASDAGLAHYQPTLRELEVMATGPVSGLMFDRDDPIRGIYVRTERGEWELVGRGALMTTPAPDLPPVARRVQPASLESVLRRFPAVQAMSATTLVARNLRRATFTGAAVASGDNEVFFGTDGLGLYRFDALVARLEPMPFGLRSSPIGAVELIPGGGWVAGGAWVGTDGNESVPAGFARVPEDLQNIRYEDTGPAAPAFREIRDVLARAPEIWGGTERGVVRFEPGQPWRMVDAGSGLPGDRVLSLAQGPAGVWIGTDRGLAFSPGAAAPVPVGQARDPVLSLYAIGDTVWVGTTRGLRVGVAGSADLFVPPDVDAERALAAPITAITRNIDTLVVATTDRIAWKAPRGTWMVERVLSEIGGLRALAADRAGVWIGGSMGLAFFRFNGRSIMSFPGPEHLPGSVTGIVVAGPYLWIGTERGLVRFARRALVP